MKYAQIIPGDDGKCWKNNPELDNGDTCCCNCAHHWSVNGHPLVTNTPISKPTGLFVCLAMGYEDRERTAIASDGHGLCEMHTPMNSAKRSGEAV